MGSFAQLLSSGGPGGRKARIVSLASVLALLAPCAAQADPLDVSTALTDPVTTGSASNGTAGDVTVESAGSIIVSTTGPALTVNSSNAVTNGGTIESSAATGATAVLIGGTSPITTTFTNNGTIGVTGTGGSGNFGIRLTGPTSGTIVSGIASTVTAAGDDATGVSIESAFTGDIGLHSVSVTGLTSTAISLTAPLTGNLTLTGTNSASGSGDTALFIGDTVSGAVTDSGDIVGGTSSGTTTTDTGGTTTTAAVGGPAAVRIAGSIGGGFINDEYYVDSTGAIVQPASADSSDILTKSLIDGYGGTTALLVAPNENSPSAIELSPYQGGGSDTAYGIVNAGSMTTEGNNPGTAATAVSISGATINGVAYGVTIDNGLLNEASGTIQSNATDANATAIHIGSGATIPTIINAGVIQTVVSDSSVGGNAYGIQTDSGANLTSITNSGTIAATAAGTGYNAYAITDGAGSVASITNSGTIEATSPNGSAYAIDLSAGTGAQTVTNSGTITGDIAFGSGADSYISDSGDFTGTLAFGSGAGLLELDGASVFSNPVTVASGGSLAVTLTGTSSLHFTGTAPTLSTLSADDQSVLILDTTGTGSALAVTGSASFTGQSQIKLNVLKPVGSTQFAILTAGGGITTDHADSLLASNFLPFLYSLDGYSVTDSQILVSVHQKTASEIGFAPAIAPLFDQSLVAMAGGGAAFDAIAGLPDQASVLAAYRQIEPPTYGSGPLRVAEGLELAGTGMVGDRMNALLLDPPGASGSDTRFGLWTQEGGQFLHQRDAQDDPGFSSNGLLLALGADYRLTSHLVAGVALNFGWNNLTTAGASAKSGTPLSIHSSVADVYVGWHAGAFYLQAVGTAGINHYSFTRSIDIGDFTALQNANWSGNQFGGSLIGGARLHFGRFLVQPSDSLTYLRLHQDGYSESGGDVFDLAVQSQQARLAINDAKLALGYDIPLGQEGGMIEVMGHGAYISRLDRHVPDVNASFLSGGDAFTLTSLPLERSETEEGATIGYRQSDVYVALDGSRRQETGASDTSVSAVLRMNF